MGAVLVAVAAHTVVAFSLVGRRWSAESIPVEVSLGPAAGLVGGLGCVRREKSGCMECRTGTYGRALQHRHWGRGCPRGLRSSQ